jgi:uncharacterized protein
MQTKMVVTGVTTDPVNNAPIVLLQDKSSGQVLPLLIGVIEASAIVAELEKVPLRRPLTHDFLRSTVEVLGGAVQRVNIVDWRDNIFFSRVVFMQGERTVEVDARPSDAIALALRTGAPIFCESSVLERARATNNRLEVAQPANMLPPVRIDADDGYNDGDDDADEGEDGPLPLLEHAGTSMADLLENLPPETFGKYKM